MVQVPLLEGGDGVDLGGAAARGQDDLRQRDRLGQLQRGHDPHRRVQHAQDLKGRRGIDGSINR